LAARWMSAIVARHSSPGRAPHCAGPSRSARIPVTPARESPLSRQPSAAGTLAGAKADQPALFLQPCQTRQVWHKIRRGFTG
jgi:hypothetical protein